MRCMPYGWGPNRRPYYSSSVHTITHVCCNIGPGTTTVSALPRRTVVCAARPIVGLMWSWLLPLSVEMDEIKPTCVPLRISHTQNLKQLGMTTGKTTTVRKWFLFFVHRNSLVHLILNQDERGPRHNPSAERKGGIASIGSAEETPITHGPRI